MFAMLMFGLFIIFSSGLNNVSAAPVPAINSTNGSSYNSGGNVSLAASNIIDQNINQVTTNVVRPKVNITDPTINAVNIPTNKTINITFTKPIKLGSNPWIEFKTNKGVSVPFAKTVNGNELLITPNSNLANGESYEVILHSNSITDLSGIGITLYSTNFTTITRPVMVSSNPVYNAVNVPNNKVIQIKFSRSISSVNNSGIQFINSKGTEIPFTSTITGNTLNIKPTPLLAHGAQYTIILHTNSVKDMGGNGIAVSSIKFTTIIATGTFSNYNATFNYPATWTVLSQPQDGTNLIFISTTDYSPTAPQGVLAISPGPGGMTDAELLQLVANSQYPSGFTVLSKKMVTLNGNSAFDILFTINNKQEYPVTMETQEIDIVKNGVVYSLDLTATPKEFSSVKTDFDIIISSLKIS